MKTIIGVTGGVGAGKSSVLQILKERHQARLIMADEVGRELMEPGGCCYGQIVSRFGSSITPDGGRIDRAALAGLVFADPEKLHALNRIVHPAVYDVIRRVTEDVADGLIVIEAALLLEAGYAGLCDCVWYVYAEPEVRIKRLMESRGYSRQKAEAIMKNQLSDEQFRAGCRIVIDNGNAIEDTILQIDRAVNLCYNVC